jgi:hypothetical protein
MARVIGQTKSWVLWIAGTLCALVFGRPVQSGEQIQMDYGVRQRPLPPVNQPAVSEEDRKKAEKLLADYLTPPPAGEPSAEQKAAMEKLVKDFGSADFKTREDASVQAAKLGPAVLGLLREAAKAKDPEVASRAGAAVVAVENVARQATVDEMKKIQNASIRVVSQQINDTRYRLLVKANETAAAADKAGKADEAAKAREEAARCTQLCTTLTALYAQIVPSRKGGGEMVPVYGIRPQLERE